ncbi:MAG: glycosyltransferase family 4 protein [Terracidiphilus sp.]
MKPLKVLMLSRGFSEGNGIARVLLTYARHYDRQRVELHIASFKPFAPAMAEALGQTGTILHELGDRGYLRPALALRKLIREQGFDLAVATTLKPYLLAKLVSGQRCRVLYWIHGIALVTESWLKATVYRWAARRDTLIFISDLVRQAHCYAGHRGREAVVLNGVDDPLETGLLYPSSEREKLGIPRSAFVVGYTAAFIGWKQHETLLAAFSQLAPEFPRMHLLLIGTGELWQGMQALARTMPGGERIHFPGLRPDARQLLGLVDVYAHPSNGEGFGLALVEAMLASRAVVVSDAGALPEIIDDGETGLICRVLDAADLAAKIAFLERDPELRRRLGERARAVALERFGAKRFAERMTEVLEGEPGATSRTPSLGKEDFDQGTNSRASSTAAS